MAQQTLDYSGLVADVRAAFNTGETKTRQWRVSQLRATLKMLTDEKERFIDALNKDLNKDAYDSCVDEIDFCINECKWFISNLTRLMKDKKKSVDFLNIGGSAYVHFEPFGVILNIGAWNYPVQIPISTMINMIAAGNCVVIKPSELSSNTAHLLAELFPRYMDNDCIKIALGGVPETTALLKERWDHVMYTGSGMVGKIVYKAAAEHLTPCTLELGGKCPSYVDQGCDLEAVCNRICWTKFKNAGQTCISVDYVLVDSKVKDDFVKAMKAAILEQYSNNPKHIEGYCRIINERHFHRVMDLLKTTSGKVLHGGAETADLEDLYIPPTMIVDPKQADKLMQEEIFGPLLPIMTVRDHFEAIEYINAREKPLHLNVFTKRQAIIDEFVTRTSSGGVSANDCLIFRIERGLPFGGVGASGFGAYGGDGGFVNFSHQKSVLLKSQGFEWLFKLMRYMPHTPVKMDRLQKIQTLPNKIGNTLKFLAILIPIGAILGVALYFGIFKENPLIEAAKTDL